jgi:transposase InsO family protein
MTAPLNIQQILLRHARSFVAKLPQAGAAKVDGIEISIPAGKQIYVPPRPINPTMIEDLRREIEDMKSSGVIEPSIARHNTPLLVIRKPNGKLRVCADLRALNRVCEEFSWEFPRLDIAVSRMMTATIFSKIDLTSGFWQLPLTAASRDFTTFRFDNSVWRFAVVPFGWKGAPAAFQSVMDSVLRDGIHQGFLTVYMDDILVHSRNLDDHCNHLDWTFRTLERCNLKVNPDKCTFGVKEVEFLGHMISADGIKPKPDKLDIIQNLHAPKNVRELRSLLGTIGFYQSFIPGFASVVRPMTRLLSKKSKFHWGNDQEAALIKIKSAFQAPNPLAYVDPENTTGFELITDASASAIGAQLIRIDRSGEKSLVSNVSRILSPAESRYSNTERELLAIVWALKRLEITMAGKPTSIFTDHAALLPILLGTVKNVSTPRVERLRSKLTRFIPAGISLYHISGKNNSADLLSRPKGLSARSKERAMPTAPSPTFLGGEEHPPKQLAPLNRAPARKTKTRKTKPSSPPGRLERNRKTKPRSQPPEDSSESESDSASEADPDRSDSSDDETGTPHQSETEEPLSTIGQPRRPLCILRLSEVISAQSKDRSAQKLIKWLRRPSGPEPMPGSREYRIIDGIIYHPRPDPVTNRIVNRLYIPLPLRERAITTAHTSGHVGYDVVIKTLENFAYWPGFRHDTRTFLNQCLVCKEKATSHPKVPFGSFPTPPHPWHTVGMDLLQLPVTKRGNKYLLVLIDILTRYATAIPLMDKSASQVVSALKRYVFNDGLLGPPAVILTDNGLEFCNAAVTRLLKRHGTRHAYTTPYNPKGNGATERLNRTLLSLLRGILTPGLEWDRHVQTVLNIYNHCSHSAIKLSPYEAITGRPARHPQLLPDARTPLLQPQDPVKLTETALPVTNARLRQRYGTRNGFNEAWQTAENDWLRQLSSHLGALRETHAHTKRRHHDSANAHRTPASFQDGDLVVVRDVHRPPGVEGKLRRPYLGPWQVVEVHTNNTLSLSDLEGNLLPRRVPFDHVHPWVSAEPASQRQGGENVTTLVTRKH